jgi:hypothetical protein
MKKLLLLTLLPLTIFAYAQDHVADTSVRSTSAAVQTKNVSNSRKWLIGSFTTAGFGGSFIFLDAAWYKGYPRSGFHTFNDVGEWLQIDKVGHAWTAYQTSRLTSAMWKWAGVSENNAVLLGSGSSLLYMLSIEYLDGLSAEWGWSWGDAGADILGATLFSTQQLAWKTQKISLKFSSTPRTYDPSLRGRADSLFGSSFQGRLLKDYNAQSYWLSFNLKSLLPSSNLPAWLNVSLGYGADGLYGGMENRDNSGKTTFDRRDIKRYRQWYLAPDVDLTRIKTNSRFLKTVFTTFNMLKFPVPALELSNSKLRFHLLQF